MTDICIVAFCDFLGFESLISSYQNKQDLDDELKKLLAAIDEAEKFISDFDLKYKFFTDNLVLSAQIDQSDFGEGPLGTILGALSLYQLILTSHGYFIRGGIDAGYHYADDKIVYGDAIISAHYLESKKAIYPRILVGPKLEKLIEKHASWYGGQKSAMPHNDYLEFASKEMYIQYLYGSLSFCENDANAIKELIKRHKEQIEINLNNQKHPQSVMEKYNWVRNYHNEFCKMIPQFNKYIIK